MSKGSGFAIALIAVAMMFVPTTLAAGKGGGGGGGGGTDCKNAEESVGDLSTTAARKAIACMINDERGRHARGALKKNKILQRLAHKHTKKMVQTDCLGHQCPGEPSLDSRIKKSGYAKGASDYRFGENTGCAVSVKSMVANWMASRFHRLNILDKGFRDMGVGFVDGRVPSRCAQSYGTFTVVFGVRKG